MGALILDSSRFQEYGPETVEKWNERIYREMLETDEVPEHFREDQEGTGWFDRW